MIRIKDVSRFVGWGTDVRMAILSHIQCTIRPGTITLLAGRTGSGKSTLLQVLAGLQPPQEGQVLFGEYSLWSKGKPDRKLMKDIGIVFQYPEQQLFASSVEEEIRYSLRPYSLAGGVRRDTIEEAIRAAGLSDELRARSPFTLSGGEKRKTALASVIAAKPRWLLLDEPSSGLDGKDAAGLAEWLHAYKGTNGTDGGIVVATHDLDLFLPVADHVILLRNGSIFGEFTPDDPVRGSELLEQAGIGVPSCLKLAAMGAWSSPGLDAESLADGILASAARSSGNAAPVGVTKGLHRTLHPLHPAASALKADTRFESLDPRTKWLFYVLFSVGMFVHTGWNTILLGAVSIGFIGVVSGIPPRRWIKPLLPFALFIMISSVISGLQLNVSIQPFSLSGTTFSWDSWMRTVRRLVALLPVMAGGLLFAATTGPTMMKRGLLITLRAIPGFKAPAETLSMAASLLFRFLKVIVADMERFAFIAASRGKKGGKPGVLRLRQLPVFLTPLLISLLQHAEELSVAMEARGYGRTGIRRTNAVTLRMKSRDYWGIGGAVLLFILMVLSGTSG